VPSFLFGSERIRPRVADCEGSLMLRSRKTFWRVGLIATLIAAMLHCDRREARGDVTSEEVEHAIREGVRYLKDKRAPDGSWTDVDGAARTGTTSLVALALMTAGEKPNSPFLQQTLEYLRQFNPDVLNSTYAVGLQTMVFAAAEPVRDRNRILANVEFLERGQIKLGERTLWPGSWNYHIPMHPGDNSNTQYALLGLNAAREAGVTIRPEVWLLSRTYFELSINRDGGWGYTPQQKQSTASMTCAGISSLILTGARRYESLEHLQGEGIRDCGKGGYNPFVNRGIDWLANHFDVRQNFGNGQQWRYYYLYALERAGRLAGVRFLGQNDWYRMGAEQLVQDQNKLSGFWRGTIQENEIVATSFALLFLAKGRAPVLINKLRHSQAQDWNNDPDDVRNMVSIVAEDWKNLLAWQVVDPRTATIQEMLQAPIVFFNGHEAPEFSPQAKKNLQAFVEQGGFIFADACCGSRGFDRGFRQLMKELFPDPSIELKALPADHPVWRSKHLLSPEVHPLLGIDYGCRTVVIYSPVDLSCYWNQLERSPANVAVIKSIKVGQNVIDYATGRELPADKLVIRDVVDFKKDDIKRGALQIAKLKHSGDWNIAPQAIPNLMEVLRKPPLSFDVVIKQKELLPRDTNLPYYPLIYVHGRAALSFDDTDLEALRKHLDPGSGTLFADAACGSVNFDASFRKFVALLLPNNPLVPIPQNDELYTKKVGFDLNDVHYTESAGGARGFPQLEGVKIDNHWAIIYSKFDIGCALERHTGMGCKGYVHESAVRIAANIVIYSTLP
jgi:hypothetical protein